MANRTAQANYARPLTSHPLFPAVTALWLGSLLGLASLVAPPSALEALVHTLRIDRVVAQAAPPLGFTARVLIALGLTALGLVLGGLIGRLLGRGSRAGTEVVDEEALSGPYIAEPEFEADTDPETCQVQPAEFEPEQQPVATAPDETETAIEPPAAMLAAPERPAQVFSIADAGIAPLDTASSNAMMDAIYGPDPVENSVAASLPALADEALATAEPAVADEPVAMAAPIAAEPEEVPFVAEPEEPATVRRAFGSRLPVSDNPMPADPVAIPDTSPAPAAAANEFDRTDAVAEQAVAEEPEQPEVDPMLPVEAVEPEPIDQPALKTEVSDSIPVSEGAVATRAPIDESLPLPDLALRLTALLEGRRAVALQDAPAEPAGEPEQVIPLALPAALRPIDFDAPLGADDGMLDGPLPPRSLNPTYVAPPRKEAVSLDAFDEDDEDWIDAEARFSSLLSLAPRPPVAPIPAPATPVTEAAPIAAMASEPESEPAPLVIFPGQSMTMAAPATSAMVSTEAASGETSGLPEPVAPAIDDTEHALRSALEKLQRLSGAA